MTTQHHRYHTAYSYVTHPLKITPEKGIPNVYKQADDLGGERGLVNVNHAAELLSCLYDDKEYLDHTAQECYRVTQNPAFRWDKIAEGFEKAIEEVCK